jgi:hypothetical protein
VDPIANPMLAFCQRNAVAVQPFTAPTLVAVCPLPRLSLFSLVSCFFFCFLINLKFIQQFSY